MKNRQKQINNLKIRYDNVYEKWNVITPDGIILESFLYKNDAISCAKSIFDFCKEELQLA